MVTTEQPWDIRARHDADMRNRWEAHKERAARALASFEYYCPDCGRRLCGKRDDLKRCRAAIALQNANA